MEKMKSLIEKRFSFDEDIDKIVGAEIKHRRLKMSKTLASIAYNTCSISYASKIENNLITPNRMCLEQLCKKLKLTEKDIENLLNLKEILLNTVFNFYFENYTNLENIYQEIYIFDNYRSEIIKLIYSLTKKNYGLVRIIVSRLEKMYESLSNIDMIVYGVFSGIFYYEQEMYVKAIYSLKLILKYTDNNRYLRALCLEYLCKCSYSLNSLEFHYYCKEAINEILIIGNLGKILVINELCLFYSLKNESLDKNELYLNRMILSKKYKAYFALVDLKRNKLNNLENLKEIDGFIYLICAYYTNLELFKEEIIKVDDSIFTIKQSVFLSHCKMLAFNEDSMKYLIEVAYPYALNTKDAYLCNLYGQHLIDYHSKKSLYKKALQYSIEIKNVILEVNAL